MSSILLGWPIAPSYMSPNAGDGGIFSGMGVLAYVTVGLH
jgi:hypothetical protein